MTLSRRLQENTRPRRRPLTSGGSPRPDGVDAIRPADPLADLKARVQDVLFSRLGARLYDASMNDAQLHDLVTRDLRNIVANERAPLSPAERERLVDELCDDVLGFGPVDKLLDDPTVTEVMVNGPNRIYVERDGKLHLTDEHFVSEDHLRRVIERMASQVGRRVDESSPMVDARLPDGSRINAIVAPLAVDGSSLTVRKFAREPLTVNHLIQFGTLSEDMADLLERCVRGRLNILVTGGTGTGKTTLLNVLSAFIPADERIVTIEDAVELQLNQDHVVRLETRPPNIEGKGQVTTRELLRNALRMRPDRIVVGEARGGEALDMLQAMNTGHEGSLSTLHANSPRDALARLETMVLMAGLELPSRAIREQVASAVDVIIHLARLRDGSRRVTHLTEVAGMEGETITLQDLFLFDYQAGAATDGRPAGRAVSTGLRATFVERLQDRGLEVPLQLFGGGPAAPRRSAATTAGRRR